MTSGAFADNLEQRMSDAGVHISVSAISASIKDAGESLTHKLTQQSRHF